MPSGSSATTPPPHCSRSATARWPSFVATSPGRHRRWPPPSPSGSDAGFRSSTILRAVLCWLTGRNGEIERSLELGREAVALAHQPFNPIIRAQALFALGVAETLADLPDAAGEHLGEALSIHQAVGHDPRDGNGSSPPRNPRSHARRSRRCDRASPSCHQARRRGRAAVDGDAGGPFHGRSAGRRPSPNWPAESSATPRPSARCSATSRPPTSACSSRPRWPRRPNRSARRPWVERPQQGAELSFTDLPSLLAT